MASSWRLSDGVMDPLALRAGNALLGNEENAAAIEVQMFPFRVRFLADTWIALTGADCRARLDGDELPAWWAARYVKDRCLSCVFPVAAHAATYAWQGALMSLWFWARAVPLCVAVSADSRAATTARRRAVLWSLAGGATPGFRMALSRRKWP
ncbi:urea amidolyase [Klebsiella aerogenes]|nr:urea amidolyase [Klebsiella aerogenes]